MTQSERLPQRGSTKSNLVKFFQPCRVFLPLVPAFQRLNILKGGRVRHPWNPRGRIEFFNRQSIVSRLLFLSCRRRGRNTTRRKHRMKLLISQQVYLYLGRICYAGHVSIFPCTTSIGGLRHSRRSDRIGWSINTFPGSMRDVTEHPEVSDNVPAR